MESAARLHPIPHLMRTVWLQVLRRKDMYLLDLVMVLFGIGAIIARTLGIDSPQMARFVASLGFTLSSTLVGTLAIIVAAQQLPGEIESRTIYPVLAKPVSRDQLAAGKFLPILIVCSAMLAVCSAITLATSPHLPLQNRVVLLEAFVLELVSVAALTAMMFAFSLVMPPSVAMVAGFFLYFFGGMVLSAGHQALAPHPAFRVLLRFIPDFSLLDQFQRYVDGGPALGALAFAGCLLYGLLWFALFARLTLVIFRRRGL